MYENPEARKTNSEEMKEAEYEWSIECAGLLVRPGKHAKS